MFFRLNQDVFNFHLSSSGDIWAKDVNLNNGTFAGTINSSATIQGATIKTALASSTISVSPAIIPIGTS